MILGVPSSVSRTLAGFRSRWMTPCLVGGVHGPRQRLDQPRRLRGGSGVPSSLLVQAAAVAELQREDGHAVVLADLVDLDDVGMLQAGDGLRLGAGSGPARPRRRGRRPGSSSGRPGGSAGSAGPCRRRPCRPAQLPQDLVAGDCRQCPAPAHRQGASSGRALPSAGCRDGKCR